MSLTAGRNDLERFIGCGDDCYEQTSSQQSQEELSQDYLLISGGKFVMDERDQSVKQVRFSSLYCGNGLADDNRGVRVETPGPAVVRSVNFHSALNIIFSPPASLRTTG